MLSTATKKTDAKGKGKTRSRYIRYMSVISPQTLWACAPSLDTKLQSCQLHPFAHHGRRHPTSTGTTTPNNGGSCFVRLHVKQGLSAVLVVHFCTIGGSLKGLFPWRLRLLRADRLWQLCSCFHPPPSLWYPFVVSMCVLIVSCAVL